MCVCVCVCVVIPFILDARLVDVPAGVTQEEGHTGFLHLASAVLALIFLARKIQPFLFLVDRDVEFCVLMNLSFSPCKPHLPRDDSPSLSLQCMSHAVLSKFIKYICIYIYWSHFVSFQSFGFFKNRVRSFFVFPTVHAATITDH